MTAHTAELDLPRHSAIWLATPVVLLIAGVLAWFVSDRLGTIGPFDRAKVGWAVVVPLLALAPGSAVLATRRTQRPALANLVIAGISLVTALVVLLWMTAATTFMDCRPVTDSMAVLVRTIPTAVVVGASFGIAARVARGPKGERNPLKPLVVGAIVWFIGMTLALVVWIVSFPPLSCAAPSS